MVRATGRAVCGFFAQALERHGVPEEILTDNGKVFTNRFGLKPTEVLFDKICRENGITHRLTAPASPTTTGKVERFHRTLRQSSWAARSSRPCSSPKRARHLGHDYNTERPHQGLDMATPAERFGAAQDRAVPICRDLRVVTEDRSARTGSPAPSRSTGRSRSPTRSSASASTAVATSIDVHVLENLLEVWDGPELIKTVLRSSQRGGEEEEGRKALEHRNEVVSLNRT